MSTVVYFVQSHRDPEQVHRLVRTLHDGSPSALVLLRHDAARVELDWGALAALPRLHRLEGPSGLVRSHFSCQVEPYLEAVEWLEARSIDYDWLVNLTAQDYPVMPVAAIEAELAAAECDGYLRFWDVLAGPSPWSVRKARRRYWYRYRWLSPRALPVLRALRPLVRALPGVHLYLDYGALVGVRRWSTPLGEGLRCHGGWAWFTLRRVAVRYLRDFLATHPAVVEHYRRTVAPEESLVPTVLAGSGGRLRLVDDDRRFIDYAAADRGSPRTLTVADLPALRRGRYHFARKFDRAVDGEVLARIDHELLR